MVFSVCIKHFRDEDVELLHMLPNGDGTFTEISLGKFKLKDDTVPCLLPGCPSYYSSTWSINGLVCPMSYDIKENRLIKPFNLV